MNLDKISDRLGDWNPQLLRELKGRFTSNSLTFILIGSAMAQVLFGLWLVHGSDVQQRIDSGLFCLNWLLPSVAIFSGTYSLISNLNRERKSGTFDFIASSPQSGRSIFLGKLLGVPSLVYLVILSVIPLHLGLALVSGASLWLMLLWYLSVGSIGYVCLVATCLYSLYGGKFAIVYALFISQPISTVLFFYNYYLSDAIGNSTTIRAEILNLTWFYLPIGDNVWLFYSFTSVTLIAITNCLWVVVDRKYVDLTATAIDKKDSYAINFGMQLWLLGFALPLMKLTDNDGNFYILWTFQTISTVWIICTLPMLLPNRRSLQEWIVEWQQQHGKLWLFDWREPTLRHELIWHDRSPALVAVGINLAIAAIVWTIVTVIGFSLSPNIDLFGKFIIGVIMSSILTLIYTALVHSQCLRAHRTNSEVIPFILLMSSLPLVCSFFLIAGWSSGAIYQQLSLVSLLFSPFFWMGIIQLSYPAIALTALFQLGILMGSLKMFDRQLLKIGAAHMRAIEQQKLSLDRNSN
jgi:hypothetical protein